MSTYRISTPPKAYEDIAFLKRNELRPVRMHAELLQAQIVLDEHCVESTVVVFGSARVPSPEEAQERLAAARERLAADPADPAARHQLQVAESHCRDSRYYEIAREFGRIVSRYSAERTPPETLDYVIMTGGGPGIMEAANRGASDLGAPSVGLNITLPHEQRPNPYISPEFNFNFHYFALRKLHFLMRARALIAFPGGFGTMDELFEALTLIQTGKTRRIPVILFGREFWDSVIHWQAFVDRGMISAADLDLIQYAETAEDGFDLILRFYGERRG